jgi:cysteine protease ATG4
MADSEFARYGRKIAQYFYDPPPHNENIGVPIFCLGARYDNPPRPTTASEFAPHQIPSSPDSSASLPRSHEAPSDFEEISKSQVEESRAAQHDTAAIDADGSWPIPFLDDFESRPWLTYRSNFPPIPKSSDPKATSSMSFGVRITQFVQREGFTSDTHWGCMIRSGQSLLANSLMDLELGRGEHARMKNGSRLTNDRLAERWPTWR